MIDSILLTVLLGLVLLMTPGVLYIRWLRAELRILRGRNNWQATTLGTLAADLRATQAELKDYREIIIQLPTDPTDPLIEWIEQRPTRDARRYE